MSVRTEVDLVEAAEPQGLRGGSTCADAFSGELSTSPFPVDYDHVRSPRTKGRGGEGAEGADRCAEGLRGDGGADAC